MSNYSIDGGKTCQLCGSKLIAGFDHGCKPKELSNKVNSREAKKESSNLDRRQG